MSFKKLWRQTGELSILDERTFPTLSGAERWIRRAGLVATLGTLATILWGLWRSTRRPTGHQSGRVPATVRQPLFYALLSLGYFGVCALLWRPLRLSLSWPTRVVALFLGSLLHFTGLALVLWGRLALGPMYNVSSGLGAHLYTDQQLVTAGPYAYARHPMYLGLFLAAVGGLLLYRVWTFPFVIVTFLGLPARAGHEEQALATEFGPVWEAYCRRVPRWLPRLQNIG